MRYGNGFDKQRDMESNNISLLRKKISIRDKKMSLKFWHFHFVARAVRFSFCCKLSPSSSLLRLFDHSSQ